MTSEQMTVFEINSATDTSPITIGQPASEVLAVFAHDKVTKSPRGDGTIPGSSVYIASGMDTKLVFDGDDHLVYFELFSKPSLPRTVTVAGVEFDFRRATLKNLQEAGLQVMVEDDGYYLVPEFNMVMGLPRSRSEVADLIVSTDEYFADLLKILDELKPYEPPQRKPKAS